MNLIIGAHHIIIIIAILGGGIWSLFKFYLKSFTREIKDELSREITHTRKSIEDKKDQEFLELKKNADKDYDNLSTLIRSESSVESIKNKVSDYVNGEFKLIEQDIKQIKELSGDVKTILSNQQETLIAIQLNLTELKPRIANLESRVSNLEKNGQNAT